MLLRDSVTRAARRSLWQQQQQHQVAYTQQRSSFASTSHAAQQQQQDLAAESENGDGSSKKAPAKAKRSKKIGPLNFSIESFPSLLHEAHPVLDTVETFETPASPQNPYGSTISFFNHTKVFEPTPPSAASLILEGGGSNEGDNDSGKYLSSITPFSPREVERLHQHLLKVKRVTQMTGKGKISRMAALVVAGNGKGLVGYGEGKDDNAGKANKKAFHEAVKSMDYVERFEGRTILAEARLKYGPTTVTLRPRPAGFGLRVPPVIHAVASSCGISDLSASILGSNNPHNVVRATLQLLWGGSAPLGLGDGVGGSMRRKDKGVGIKTIRDMELARGRRLREVPI